MAVNNNSLLGRVMNLFTGSENLPKIKPFQEMGVSGTAVFSGLPQIRERNAKLVGTEKWITFSELMTNTSIVAAGLRYFLNVVANSSWSMEPADDSAEALAVAEFIEDCLNDMNTPFRRIVRRSSMYRFHGFGIQEWTAKRRKQDKKIGLDDIEARPQHTIERWQVDERGSVIGVWQRAPHGGELLYLPREKIIYLVEDSLTDAPDGLGLLRHLIEPYERLKRYMELEGRGFERDLRGIPIGRIPYSAINAAVEKGTMTKEQAALTVKQIESFVQIQAKQPDTSIVLDSQPYVNSTDSGNLITGTYQYGIELLQGGSTSFAEVGASIDRCNREMARVLGVEQLLLGEGGGANRALSEDKSRNFYLVVNGTLDEITDSMDKDVVIPLCDLNGIAENLRPKLKHSDIALRSVAEITAALRDMATAGAVLSPNDPAVNDVRDMLGIAQAPEMTPDQLGMLTGNYPPPPDEERDMHRTDGGKSDTPPTDDPGEEQAAENVAPKRQQVFKPRDDTPKGKGKQPPPMKKFSIGRLDAKPAKPVRKYLNHDNPDEGVGRVKKYNEAHDEQGRFTFMGGGAIAGNPALGGTGKIKTLEAAKEWLRSPKASKIISTVVKSPLTKAIVAASISGLLGATVDYTDSIADSVIETHVENLGNHMMVSKAIASKTLRATVTALRDARLSDPKMRTFSTLKNMEKSDDLLIQAFDAILAALDRYDANLAKDEVTKFRETMAKYNESHDELGRFASGGNSGIDRLTGSGGRGHGMNVDIKSDLSRAQSDRPRQSVHSLSELYNKSYEAEQGYYKSLDEFAKATGGELRLPPLGEFGEGSGLKPLASAERKLKDPDEGLNGDPTKLLDVLRATILYKSIEDSRNATAAYIVAHASSVVRIKDRIEKPARGGYRDIMLNVRTPNGTIAELQFNTKNLLDAKNSEGHKLYDQLRNYKGKSAAVRAYLNRKSDRLYSEAFVKDGNSKYKTKT